MSEVAQTAEKLSQTLAGSIKTNPVTTVAITVLLLVSVGQGLDNYYDRQERKIQLEQVHGRIMFVSSNVHQLMLSQQHMSEFVITNLTAGLSRK